MSADEEFIALFAQEAEVRLRRLGEQLLELESAGASADLLDDIFREAHTLKGAAAVVGLDDVSSVAHALEDLLEGLRRGESEPTGALVDTALAVVDGLNEIVPLVLVGEDCSDDAVRIIAMLEGFAVGTSDEAPTEPAVGPVAGSVAESVAVAVGAAVEAGAAEGVDSPASPASAVVPASAGPAAPHAPDAPASGAPAAGGPAPDAPAAGDPTACDPTVPGERSPRSDRAARRGAGGVGETIVVPAGRLDEIVRLVGESAAAHLRLGRMLSDRHGLDPSSVSEFRELSRVLNDLQERTMRARMVPVATITDQLHRAVRDLGRSLGKSVVWDVRGEETELDRGVLQQLADPLMHLVRNAVDHGIESPEERVARGKPVEATVRLHAMQLGSEVIIAVSDDGGGIDVDRVREEAGAQGTDTESLGDDDVLSMIFRSGLSTATFISEISGRGVGLDAVRSSVEGVRGRIEVHSEPGRGCEFRIIVPITLAVMPCLLVSAGGRRYAVPMHSVLVSVAYDPTKESRSEGRTRVWVGDRPVPVANLSDTLGHPSDPAGAGAVVVLAGVTRSHAFRVDELIGQRDVVVKGLGKLLPRLDLMAGASVEPDGSIILVLDAPGLIDRARLAHAGGDRIASALEPELMAGRGASGGAVLVVDDAMTVRELQRSILRRAGFDVRVAGDGVEALAALAEAPADLVLTDVDMPNMDGFALTEAIRAQPSTENLPILILTSRDSDTDRQRGLEAGADGYIVKSAFDEAGLLAAVNRLLGRA